MRTKIILSEEEIATLHNKDFFRVKKNILAKAESVLGEIANDEELKHEWKKIIASGNETVFQPKISRGENYEGLPWLMLDFPKQFEKQNQFAVRTFFWWGNYFSVFILLSGSSLKKFLPLMQMHFDSLQKNNFQISNNQNPFGHKVDAKNFIPMKKISKQKLKSIAAENKYLLLAAILPLSKFKKAKEFIRSNHLLLQQILHQAPRR